MSRELEAPDVWNDPERAQQLGKLRAQYEAVVDTIRGTEQGVAEAVELLELAEMENDESTVDSVIEDLAGLEEQVAQLEFRRMFSGEMDT